MKNKAKKMLTLALAATVALGSLSAMACKPSGNEDDNSTQSILYVSNYAGGFGSKWMDEIEKRFEAKYADESFEDGKVGVDIKVSHNKTLGSQYFDKVAGSKQEVFFVEDVDYYKWVNEGKMLDISSVVTEANPNDGKTVLSKLTKDEQDFYNADGKYYAIPHHDHQAGIIYDIDLFEQEGFYFAKNGAPSEKNYTGTVKFTSDGAKSAGPDGEYDTSDDGLPATYDEFYTLCDYIAKKKSDVTLVPFIWSGQNRRDYLDWLLSELTADFEGEEQLRLNYTFDGTAKNLVSVDDAGNITRLGDTKITTENGYLMYQTEGRLKALEFVDRIIDSTESNVKWGESSTLFGPDSQLQAQDKYIYGATGINSTRYAFLVDGTWWESEASDTFDRVEDRTAGKYTKNSMRFGLLSLPKASADRIGDPFTIATTEVTVGFVKSNIKESKINLAKTFMQFVYAEEQLRAFNTISGMPAAPDYKLTDAEYEALSVYEQSLYDVKDNSVSPYSTTPVYINNYSSLMLKSTFTAKGSKASESLRTRSAVEHFRDLYSKSGRDESSWKSLIKNLK